ncbi:hypothetical protein NC653_000767 [Populus alba x Populus x berolinensis]|uniref:Uncharacterized protein n=1 Tax=Populus alba x Populus x berolinensis TaxID=444605 RepID=A0AAD6WET3_9ROSI|nr:hypothetical protein NC653_000767 [Populus alba x Populus x berolinensis]
MSQRDCKNDVNIKQCDMRMHTYLYAIALLISFNLRAEPLDGILNDFSWRIFGPWISIRVDNADPAVRCCGPYNLRLDRNRCYSIVVKYLYFVAAYVATPRKESFTLWLMQSHALIRE